MYKLLVSIFAVSMLLNCTNTKPVSDSKPTEPIEQSGTEVTGKKIAAINDPWLLVGDMLKGMKNVNTFGVLLANKGYVLSELDINTNTTTGSFYDRKSEPMDFAKIEMQGFNTTEGYGVKGSKIFYKFGPGSSDAMKLHFGKIVKSVKTSGTKYAPSGKQLGTTFTIEKIYHVRIYDSSEYYEVEVTQFMDA